MQSFDELRSIDLVQFKSDGSHILFHPATLSLFRLNEASALLVRDLRTGYDADELRIMYGASTEQIDRCVRSILSSIETAAPKAMLPAFSSYLSGRDVLPKAVLMVNNFCNLKCTYCYEHSSVFKQKAMHMPKVVVRTALKKLYREFSRIESLMFIGGEPTLSEDAIECACVTAMEIAAASGIHPPEFCMISNGVRMTERMFDLIERYAIQVTFSIDGPAAVHDSVRIRHDGSGTFEEVARNVARYKSLLPEKLSVECTVTSAQQEAGLDLVELLEFCDEHFGVREPHIAAAGMSPDSPLNPYTGSISYAKQLEAAASKSMDTLQGSVNANGRRSTGCLDMVSSMSLKVLNKSTNPAMCPAGFSQLVVDSFGDMYPCWMFAGKPEHVMGNVIRDEIRNVQYQTVVKRVEANSKSNNRDCRTCYARGVCNSCTGNNENSTGKMETPDAHFCDSVRSTLRVVLHRIAGASGQRSVVDAMKKNALTEQTC